MPILLQIDFPFAGPWGTQLSVQLRELAESIAREPGLLWKIWTESPERGEAGGIYLFSDRATAEAYLEMHTRRLRAFGVSEVRGKLFEINGELSALNRAPLDGVR